MHPDEPEEPFADRARGALPSGRSVATRASLSPSRPAGANGAAGIAEVAGRTAMTINRASRQKSSAPNDGICDEIVKLLDYEPETGRLFWRISPKRKPFLLGKNAGSLDLRGYLRIVIGGKFVYGHHVAFFLYHGRWPEMIDHINEVKSDNRIANLRECTSSSNKMNVTKRWASTSTYRGVHRDQRRGKWVAKIKTAGKTKYLGAFDDEEAAFAAYRAAAIEANGEFASW